MATLIESSKANMKGKTNGENGDAAPVSVVPFVKATSEHNEQFFDKTYTLDSGSQNIDNVNVASYGFIKGVWIHVDAVTAGNIADVAFAEDGPFNVLSQLTFHDVNSTPIVGSISGYNLYLWNKWASNVPYDATTLPSYLATTGTGDSGGSFSFRLYVPISRGPRDGFGALPNMNAGQAYQVDAILGAISSVYATAPTNAPTVRVRYDLDAYSTPKANDAFGRPQATVPPLNNSVCYLTSSPNREVNAGQFTLRHNRTGNYIRNLVYVFRDDTDGTRATAEAAMAEARYQWTYDTRTLTTYRRSVIRDRMAIIAGFRNGAVDDGVVILPFSTDFTGRIGAENRAQWLQTTQATRLELELTDITAETRCDIVTDDIAIQKGGI